MAAICPGCGKELDVTLFQFGRAVVCDCGRVLREPEHRITLPAPARGRTDTGSGGGPTVRWDRPEPPAGEDRPPARRDPRDERNLLMEELKREADRICRHILQSDYPEVDVAVERARLREWCERAFPDRMDLYDMVYESRFERLIEQFGEDRD